MGDSTTSTPALRPGFFKLGPKPLERLRHALSASAVALLLLASLLLQPIDWFSWIVQSRIASQEASQDIVFVGSERDLADPGAPHLRERLADALYELDRQNVDKVYIDIVFDEVSNSDSDEQLAAAIANLGSRAVLVNQIEHDGRDRNVLHRSLESIRGDSAEVFDSKVSNYLGFIWSRPFHYSHQGGQLPSFSTELAGVTPDRAGRFEVDYSISIESIPAIDLVALTDGGSGTSSIDLAGRTVVVGPSSSVTGSTVAIPGRVGVPQSYPAIYAAESLKAGPLTPINPLATLCAFIAILIAVTALVSDPRTRHIAYTAITLVTMLAIGFSGLIGWRVELSYVLAFLIVFALMRSRGRMRERLALVDQDTGLPTLKALEKSLEDDQVDDGFVVVARIHGFEQALRSLPVAAQADYVSKVADRLRATSPNAEIYTQGHYLGWHDPSENAEALGEHLEGLRAFFAAPIQVAGHSVDVGITFGVTHVDNRRIRLIPAAIAAAEETSEAFEPINFAETGQSHDMLWDISLRAKIDEAMEAGEIYCVYQPKYDVVANRITGVEALVRWQDPERGFIPPVHFVRQCEKAGRMEHLTRYVLQTACSAGQLLQHKGLPISMAVNVSATLLCDMRIVGLVANALQATRFDASNLVLEVTETARIADMETAASVLTELRKLGLKISMDDFGVGAANFETFFALPFDEIKIDRLFVSAIATDRRARAIVSSVVSMGRDSRITVVAEGLERLEDLEIVKDLGCVLVQGFALSHPISLSNLLKLNDYGQGGNLAILN